MMMNSHVFYGEECTLYTGNKQTRTIVLYTMVSNGKRTPVSLMTCKETKIADRQQATVRYQHVIASTVIASFKRSRAAVGGLPVEF